MTVPAADASGQTDVRVVVADDEELVRTGFGMILDAEPDITVVGDAGDGRSGCDPADHS
jgi:YesN/AraC family two-component response regulator